MSRILALVIKELPKDWKYHLQLMEGSNNEVRSWHWIKTNKNFNQDMQQIRKFNYRYPLKTQVANMAETVNCICHFCGQQGHKRNDCPIRRADLEAKGLNMDEINERNRQRHLANRSGGDDSVEVNVMVDGEAARPLVGAAVTEVAVMEAVVMGAAVVIKGEAAVVMVGDAITEDAVKVLAPVEDAVALDLLTMAHQSSPQSPIMRLSDVPDALAMDT